MIVNCKTHPRYQGLKLPKAKCLGCRNKFIAVHNISRQRLWQLERVAEGKCQRDGKPRNRYATLCDGCEKARRVTPSEKRAAGRPIKTIRVVK